MKLRMEMKALVCLPLRNEFSRLHFSPPSRPEIPVRDFTDFLPEDLGLTFSGFPEPQSLVRQQNCKFSAPLSMDRFPKLEEDVNKILHWFSHNWNTEQRLKLAMYLLCWKWVSLFTHTKNRGPSQGLYGLSPQYYWISPNCRKAWKISSTGSCTTRKQRLEMEALICLCPWVPVDTTLS